MTEFTEGLFFFTLCTKKRKSKTKYFIYSLTRLTESKP